MISLGAEHFNFHEIKYDSTTYLPLIFNISDGKRLDDFSSELSKDFNKGLGLNVYLLHDAGKLHTLCMKNCTMNAKWSCKSSIFIINFVFYLTKNKVLKSSSTYTVLTYLKVNLIQKFWQLAFQAQRYNHEKFSYCV